MIKVFGILACGLIGLMIVLLAIHIIFGIWAGEVKLSFSRRKSIGKAAGEYTGVKFKTYEERQKEKHGPERN